MSIIKKIINGGVNMLKLYGNYLLSLLKKKEGQGMVEYALLVALIAVVVIAVLVFVGPAIAAKFQTILDNLK